MIPDNKMDGKMLAGCFLQDLLTDIEYEVCGNVSLKGLQIGSLAADSRQVVPGSLFFAVAGETSDGHLFVDDAIRAGAVAVIVELESACFKEHDIRTVPVVGVRNSQEVLGIAAARFHGDPSERMTMIGITGTNGKTTISFLLEHVLTEAGFQVGVIGTIDYRYHCRDQGEVHWPAPYTTPDHLQLQATLKEMADNGVTHVIMEVSSHALQQKRLGPIVFSLALFTNLSQDHLDYHKTMEKYFAAKCLLFRQHMVAGAPVVIMESYSGNGEKEGWAGKVVDLCRSLELVTVRCGNSPDVNFRYLSSRLESSGMTVVCRDDTGMQRIISSPLVGQFNVENLLVSMAALVSLGIVPERVCNLLADATGAPGRLQRVILPDKPGGQPTVLVDYAHTPDAMEKVLQAVRELPHRLLYCIFGCGGDRDRSKRPLMGEIAAELSDVAIITDDNPRSEKPEMIRTEIKSGIEQAGIEIKSATWLKTRSENERGFLEIGDRAQAIRAAVTAAGPEDIVLIAGKGHEQYQITGTGKKFFDDCLTAQESALFWDLETVAAACAGRIVRRGGHENFASVSTDSRTIGNRDIFVALKGDAYDGHDFLKTAVESGAGCLLVSDSSRVVNFDVACVEVEDTLEALGNLARWRRQALKKMQNPIVVGITGSCGKTTVKEMTAAIFARHWPDRSDRPAGRVLKTTGNFNNLVGLPLSLLPVSARHRGLILEMGMNRPGEIARLTGIADPDIGCIVNIHGAHLEGLGTIEGVARAKGELFQTTDKRAVHIINLDNERVVKCAEQHSQIAIKFAVSEDGRELDPDVWAEDIETDNSGHLSMTMHAGKRQARLTIHAPGLHNSANACAAAAIACGAGIDFDTIVAGLGDFRSAENRMETVQTPLGLNILNDTYNANPASMASGLQTLSQLPAKARVAILGDMLELGEGSVKLHEELGLQAAGSDIGFLGVIGSFSENIKDGAVAGGMASERIMVFKDKRRVVDWVAELLHSGRLHSGDWVMVKASRGLALDTVVGQLLQTC